MGYTHWVVGVGMTAKKSQTSGRNRFPMGHGKKKLLVVAGVVTKRRAIVAWQKIDHGWAEKEVGDGGGSVRAGRGGGGGEGKDSIKNQWERSRCYPMDGRKKGWRRRRRRW